MRALASLLLLLVACGGRTFDEVVPDAAADAPPDSATDTAPDLRACTGPGTCSLVPMTCCGGCGQPTTESMTAVTKGREADYRAAVCGPGGGPPCPDCAPAIFDGSVQAWCVANRCLAIDVRKEPISACATDADCTLRYQSCCEPCTENPFELIALNRSQLDAYRSRVCVGDETCSKCATRYPADSFAVCDSTTKHCRVKSPMLP